MKKYWVLPGLFSFLTLIFGLIASFLWEDVVLANSLISRYSTVGELLFELSAFWLIGWTILSFTNKLRWPSKGLVFLGWLAFLCAVLLIMLEGGAD